MSASHWEHFAHDADVGVRGIGASRDEAFEQAALGLIAVVAEPFSIASAEAVTVDCDSPDPELLLVDWLNAIVYEMATRKMLFSRFQVSTNDGHLHGVAWGEPLDVVKHAPRVEIKGATYTSLSVNRMPDGRWLAQCVVDV
jgi:tRNA nucleotidyltransferase (CCA-adding enzyme)